MKHCSQCGKELQKSVDIFFRDSEVYCKECGRKYDIENGTINNNSAPKSGQNNQTIQNNSYVNEEFEELENADSNSTSNTLESLCIIIIALGLISGVILGASLGTELDSIMSGVGIFLGIALSSFVLGYLLKGIAAIINLLQKNNKILNDIKKDMNKK